jgi:hypothetical protein
MSSLPQWPSADHPSPNISIECASTESATAIARYRRSRDLRELEQTMARLDAESKAVERSRPGPSLPASEAAELLRNLPELWERAPVSKRALAESLFESIEVLGLRVMRIHPTRAALERGLVDAFQARTDVYGRGERI